MQQRRCRRHRRPDATRSHEEDRQVRQHSSVQMRRSAGGGGASEASLTDAMWIVLLRCCVCLFCACRRPSRRPLQSRRLGVHGLCEPQLRSSQQVQSVPAAPAGLHAPGAQVSRGRAEQGGRGEERGTVQSGRLGVRKVWVRLKQMLHATAAKQTTTRGEGHTTRAQEQTQDSILPFAVAAAAGAAPFARSLARCSC